MLQSLTRRRFPITILPSLVWFFIFLIIPLSIVVLFSFAHKGYYGQIEYTLDFSNYARTIEPLYLKIIFRSLFLATYTTIVCLLFAYPIAYYMAVSSKNTKRILLGLVIVPFWTNFIIRVYALKLVFGNTGIINSWLLEHQFIQSPFQFLDNSLGICIGMIYNYLPFMILPLFVSLNKIDFTLLDAAYDLGATKVQTAYKVLLPLSLPGITTGSLFVFIPAFGEFVIPEMLGGSHQMYVGTIITDTFLRSRNWPFGSALSSFLVLLTMISFIYVLAKSAKENMEHSHGV